MNQLMTNRLALRHLALAGVLALAGALGIAAGARAEQAAGIVSLYTTGQQAISPELAIRVTDASVLDRQLSITGEVVNVSRDTFNTMQLVLTLENGSEQRVSVGRLGPGASRPVQAQLATESDLKPAILRVSVAETSIDRSPGARRGR
jgi:hypothetical protein